MNIYIDFETRSPVNITAHGLMRYARDPQTEILVMGWATEDGPIEQWFPGAKLPEWTSDPSVTICAFNVQFEYEIWYNKKDLPFMPMKRWQDVAALCRRYGYPGNLDMASKIICPDLPKLAAGKGLIQKFCVPPYSDPLDKDWDLFLEYNRRDVEAERAIAQKLRPSINQWLSPMETKNFYFNWEMNKRGLPIDVDSAELIYDRVQKFKESSGKQLELLTGGTVTAPTQTMRILKAVRNEGVDIDNLQSATIDEILEKPEGEISHRARQLLSIRGAASLSSTGKYKRILDESLDGRMYYNSVYYGAHTGRNTGVGFQLLNLPRLQTPHPAQAIRDIRRSSDVDSGIARTAKGLIRSMIKAPKGKVLMVADYSSIEYVLLMWFCEEKEALQAFYERKDQYKLLASTMFGVSYEEVTKAQRQIGKYGILGCGYGLGARGFVGYAKRLGGLDIDPQQAQLTVNSFRHKYPKVPQCWYTLNDMAIVATTHPGKFFNALSCVFIYSKDRDALMLRLPSGRALVYNHPRVITGEYTPYLERAGLIQTTNTWSEHIKMTPGKWCENVIQALGRDMLQHGIMTLQNHGYDVIGTIYDEVICEVPKEKAKSIDKFCKAFSMVPQWLHGCPVRAEGYVTKRYRKG